MSRHPPCSGNAANSKTRSPGIITNNRVKKYWSSRSSLGDRNQRAAELGVHLDTGGCSSDNQGQIIKLEQKDEMGHRFDKMQPSLVSFPLWQMIGCGQKVLVNCFSPHLTQADDDSALHYQLAPLQLLAAICLFFRALITPWSPASDDCVSVVSSPGY